MSPIRLSLCIGSLFFLLDRITKWWALSSLHFNESVPLFSFCRIDFFWTLTSNEGAAWGMFFDSPIFLLVVRIVLITIALFLFFFSTKPLSRLALASVLAGAGSNLIDSLYYGAVIDMIHVRLFGWNYPIFNVADIAITLGAITFALEALFSSKGQMEK